MVEADYKDAIETRGGGTGYVGHYAQFVWGDWQRGNDVTLY